jgi:hypothetical protein
VECGQHAFTRVSMTTVITSNFFLLTVTSKLSSVVLNRVQFYHQVLCSDAGLGEFVDSVGDCELSLKCKMYIVFTESPHLEWKHCCTDDD